MRKIFAGLCLVIAFVTLTPIIATATANDFTFSSFQADYYLGSDSEGRSTLKTVEKLVAEFPNSNQNHGIERAIPTTYDGHPTSLHIDSVKGADGRAIDYTTSSDNGNEILRIGDPHRYVRGSQTYVITYTQRDVTKLFADTNDVEFYWDTNGTQWKQPFSNVVATIHLSDNVAQTFTKKTACYQGVAGSKQQCAINTDGTVITARASDVKAGENMTVAVGFTNGTFRGYEPSIADRLAALWTISLVFTSIAGLLSLFWLSYRYSKASNRTSEMEPIPPEYVPPKGFSVLTASQIGDGTKAETTAAIIDLAVRHFITIAQTQEKSLLKQAEYELEIITSIDGLSGEEVGFVQALFGSTAVGTKLQTKTLKNNYSLYSGLQKNLKTLDERIKGDYELRAKDDAKSKWFQRIGTAMLVIGLVTLSPMVLIAAAVAYGCGWTLTPLTDKGLALRRYIAGLKMYIEAAEKDRIKMLQSPEGAEKTGVSIKDGSDKKIVKLYERALPYAVLFGQEKEWNEQLAIRYERSGGAPDWYIGQSAFNAAVFTSAMNDFSGSMNSYGASTSSSSGGSGGGGSSGGGGGGGGGGGW